VLLLLSNFISASFAIAAKASLILVPSLELVKKKSMLWLFAKFYPSSTLTTKSGTSDLVAIKQSTTSGLALF
jgi:hypothetical protein